MRVGLRVQMPVGVWVPWSVFMSIRVCKYVCVCVFAFVCRRVRVRVCVFAYMY